MWNWHSSQRVKSTYCWLLQYINYSETKASDGSSKALSSSYSSCYFKTVYTMLVYIIRILLYIRTLYSSYTSSPAYLIAAGIERYSTSHTSVLRDDMMNEMTAERRGHRPMKVRLPEETTSSEYPPISALFLIYFEPRKGYLISWRKTAPGIDLDGAVEYKSLPSGLHTVKEDLVYFVHEQCAGLSAFVNVASAEESRNARMLAVGVLVPLSFGRLGRSWKHAEHLKTLAQ